MKSLLGFLTAIALSTVAFANVAPEVLAKHRAIMGGECEADQEANATAYDLAADRKLVIIPCYMGAYQGSARAYLTVGSGEATSVSQISVLALEGKTLVATLDLGDGEYDPKTKTIYTHSRGRGIGDCGQSSQSKVSVDQYGSISIKTTKIYNKDKCDGKMTDWPLAFSQK
jgi:hypothetical protein